MTWFTLSLFSLICFTGYEILSRRISVESENPLALSVVYNAVITLLTPLLFFIEPLNTKALPGQIIALTGLSIVVWALFGRVEYFSHKHVEASTLAIILKIAPVITLILSILFFQEKITFIKLAGMAVVIVSNIYVITSTQRSIDLSKGLIYALLTALFLGIGWTIDKAVAPYFGIALFSMMSFGSPTIINAVIPPIKLSALLVELKRVNWRLPVLAIFNLLGYAALVKALTLGDASRVTVISTATTPFVVLLSIFLLKERLFIGKKIIAGLLTLVGIVMLG